MPYYEELIAQRAELQRKIAEARETEVSSALATVRSLVSEFEFTVEDIFGRQKRGQKGPRVVIKPKYRDPKTGATWSGRGKPPRWIAGRDRTEFSI